MTASRLSAALLVMALIGLGISVYLTVAHYQHAPLACVQTSLVNCDAVTHSSYSVVPATSVPVSVAGVVWFLVSGILAGMGLARSQIDPTIRVVHAIWALGGIAAALWLIRAELEIIHRICEWCTAVHLLVFLSLIVTLVRVQEAVGASATMHPDLDE